MDTGIGSDEHGWRKGPWTTEEDKLLSDYVGLHGDGRWTSVAMFSGLKRNGKSCRLRWVNYLRPGLKKENLTPQEEGIIIELHAIWGNKWSTIARYLPGRTDNEIKNYWRTHFKVKPKPRQTHERRKVEALRLKKHHQTPEHKEQNNCPSSNNNDNNQDMVFPYNESVIESHHPSPIIDYHDDHGSCWSETIVGDDLWGGLWNLDDQHYRMVHQGYGVGGLLLCATISTPKIDSFISSSHLRSLGMCKRCGDLRLMACLKCRGQAVLKEGGLFGFNAMDDLSQLFRGNSTKKSLPCENCQARGHFSCPECSRMPQV